MLMSRDAGRRADGIDQDCNGVPDDAPNCVCRMGETRACYTGPMNTADVGICRSGTQTCMGGVGWGPCLNEVLPRAEICLNRLDDDCNGIGDDGMGCVCAPNTTRSCYLGAAAQIGVGIYRDGTQRCAASGMGWGACTGAVVAAMEVCGNNIDDNCNGQVDEGCPPVMCNVNVSLNGDCLTARCPGNCAFPVGCDITMAGDDDRGCVASSPGNPVVYFQEGNNCGAGRVTGTLRCSSVAGAGLNAGNCRINKPRAFYPANSASCPR